MSCQSCNFRIVVGDLVPIPEPPIPKEIPKEEPKVEKKKRSRYDKYLRMNELELEQSGVIVRRNRRR